MAYMKNNFNCKTLTDLVKDINKKMIPRALFSLTIGFLLKIPILLVYILFSPVLLLNFAVTSTDPGHVIKQESWRLIKNQVLAIRVIKNSISPCYSKTSNSTDDKLISLGFFATFFDEDQEEVIKAIYSEKRGIWHTQSYIIIKDILLLEIIPKEIVVWTYLYQERNVSYLSRFGTPFATQNDYSIVFKTCYKKTHIFKYHTDEVFWSRSSFSLVAFQDDS